MVHIEAGVVLRTSIQTSKYSSNQSFKITKPPMRSLLGVSVQKKLCLTPKGPATSSIQDCLAPL